MSSDTPQAPPSLAPPLAPPRPRHAEDAAKQADPADEPGWIIGERRVHKRPQQLALNADVWPPGAVGGSVWYAIPVAHDGLLPGVNDSFDVEFGLLGLAYLDGLLHGAIIPAAGMRWNFFLTRLWAPFVTLKLGVRFGLGNEYDPTWFTLGTSIGSMLRLSDKVALRLELGWPAGLNVGLGFLLGG